LVNLHWVTNGFLSIEEIGKIQTPIIFSMYDMWVFSGTEHYSGDSPQERWRTGYTRSNRPAGERGLDLDRWTWQRKKDAWSPRPLIAASSHFAAMARESALAEDWPISRVPHLIDTDAMYPLSREMARKSVGIPHDDPLILFVSSAGIGDERKGFDLLMKAATRAATDTPRLRVLVIGPHEPTSQPINGVQVDFFGLARSDETLRLLYCAADVVAVPSRQDNMPLTAMEAQACGRAVVASAIGGLTDIVEHQVTGFLAPPEEPDALVQGLLEAIEDARQSRQWGQEARRRAEELWSPRNVVQRYLSVYEQVLA